jgi:hypothetical protein
MIYTNVQQLSNKNNPLHELSNPALLTWRASFFARGDESLSTLVSGLPTTVPPLGFYASHPFTPHSSIYIIYIDDINNLSFLHPLSQLSSSATLMTPCLLGTIRPGPDNIGQDTTLIVLYPTPVDLNPLIKS